MSERFEQNPEKQPYVFDIGPLPVEIQDNIKNGDYVPFVQSPSADGPGTQLDVLLEKYLSNDPDIATGEVAFEGTTREGKKVKGYMSKDGSGRIEFI